MTRGRAAIVKAYYLKRPHPDIPKEVLTVSLNPDSNSIPYTLGRLFSVLEAAQHTSNPTVKGTIRDRCYNAASSNPERVFPHLIKLSQKHTKKLNPGLRQYYEKQICDLMNILPEHFPTNLNSAQQSSFHLGYYHQTQKRYEKKEKKNNE